MKFKSSRKTKGFTLSELLIVIAVVGVLVAIAIPSFNSAQEKTREAVDLENIRTACVEISTAVLLGEDTDVKTINLQQQKPDWNTQKGSSILKAYGSVNGTPAANGVCKVFYDNTTKKTLILFGGDLPLDSINALLVQNVAEAVVKDFKSIIPEAKREQARTCLHHWGGNEDNPTHSTYANEDYVAIDFPISTLSLSQGAYWDPNKHTWGEVLEKAGIDTSLLTRLGANAYVYFDIDLNPVAMSYYDEDGHYCYTYLDNGETLKFTAPYGERATPAYLRDYARSVWELYGVH